MLAQHINITLETTTGSSIEYIKVETNKYTWSIRRGDLSRSVKYDIGGTFYIPLTEGDQEYFAFKREEVILPGSISDPDLYDQLLDLFFVPDDGSSVGLATEATLLSVDSNLGTDGAAAPIIPGTGVRGWLRSIYDSIQTLLISTINVNVTNVSPIDVNVLNEVEIKNDLGNPVPVDVMGCVDLCPNTPATAYYIDCVNPFNLERTQQDVKNLLSKIETVLGTQGPGAPIIVGTGILGYLRALYQSFLTGLGSVGALPLPISGLGILGYLRTTYERLHTTLPVSVGQKTSAGSLSVVLSSDSSVTVQTVTTAPLKFVNYNLTNSPLLVNAGNCNFIGFSVINTHNSDAYVKLYNSAAPVIGVSAPDLIAIANGAAGNQGPQSQFFPVDINSLVSFSNLSVAATRFSNIGDTTAPANPLIIHLFYRV